MSFITELLQRSKINKVFWLSNKDDSNQIKLNINIFQNRQIIYKTILDIKIKKY